MRVDSMSSTRRSSFTKGSGGALLLGVLLAGAATPAIAELPTIERKTASLVKLDGLFPLYWDGREGKLWLEIPRLDTEFLYLTSLPAGLGSNDIGLDRGQVSEEGAHVVRFERVGPRVLLVERNTAYRAESSNADERTAVEEAFARSVLWGFKIEAESDGRALVDATDFAVRDVRDVTGALKRSGQGSYSLDATRSALYLPRTKSFPSNTEIEVTLTFTTSDPPGEWVSSVTPSPRAVTLRERHSLVRLPPPGFVPRESDPRAGFTALVYADYAAPLGRPLARRLIQRHRLRKKDPTEVVGEPVEPIVYYLDRGTPEPVRSALLEGARWWERAFEAAGYRGAFRVEMLPEGADPMDVRYNTIQWVHRATRGWSYGNSVVDPRTGEIIKGHVSLGSLRVRQDYLIAEGLLSPYTNGDEESAEVREVALARIRQLAAHEVGHTLGLAHNYVSSAEGRASVMDYPHPLIRTAPDGSLDLSDAYAVGVGEWDQVAIDYGYRDFPEGTDVPAALGRILAGARDRGLTFLTDQDARPGGSAHPQAHLWDNGRDAAEELTRTMQVRRRALERFGEAAIRNGAPLATLEEALVPLYLHHRYQVEAAAKMVAGVSYTYVLRGDGQVPLALVKGADQGRALDALLSTLAPVELALPRSVLRSLPPRPATYPLHRELFPRWTGLVFDPLSPVQVAADLTISILLEPERCARLVAQAALDPSLPSLADVLARLVGATFDARPADPYEQEVGRVAQGVVVDRLRRLAVESPMLQVRARSEEALAALAVRLRGEPGTDGAERAHRSYLAREIDRFLERAATVPPPPGPLAPPPGSPIGLPPAGGLAGTEPACSQD